VAKSVAKKITNNTPIEEYIFWKHFIDKKIKTNELIPEILYEFLDKAETNMMFYLINKHHILNSQEDSLKSIH
jgi:hypothetical protein